MDSNLDVPASNASGGSATGSVRNKVVLKKGRGLMDWVKLGHTSEDLAGSSGKILQISAKELANHNSRNDAWIALKGKVYNITPYMEYHPGGESELMRGAGIDATDLFNEVHKWVNFDSLLQKCFLGYLTESKFSFPKPGFLPLRLLGQYADFKVNNSLRPPAPPQTNGQPQENKRISSRAPPATPEPLPTPKYDWFQTKTVLNIAIYTKWKHMCRHHVVVRKVMQEVWVFCYIQDQVYTVHVYLQHDVADPCEVRVGNSSGKVDVLFTKVTSGVRWNSLGKSLHGNNELVPSRNLETEYLIFRIADKEEVTHNTRLFTLEVPDNVKFSLPVGYHVLLRLPHSDVAKPYTPIYFPLKVPHEEVSEGNKLYFLIKIYSDGQLTPKLDECQVGDSLEVSLPQGSLTAEELEQMCKNSSHLVLLGAGTGITPLLKLLLLSLTANTKTLLIFFNRSEMDIPWREELDHLAENHSSIFRVCYILSNPDSGWNGKRGFVRKELLDALLPISDGEESSYLCICGPKPFTEKTESILRELGYMKECIRTFLG